MNYSYKDIIKSYSEEKQLSDKNHHFILYYIYRPISFPITWVLLKFNLTSNFVTVITILISFSLIPLLISEFIIHKYIAALMMFMYLVLDCVDGNIARTTKKSNKVGEFLDLFSGLLFWAIVFPSIGYGVLQENIILKDYDYLLSNVGYSITILFFISRLLNQEVKNNLIDKKIDQTLINPKIFLIIKSFYDLVPIIYFLFLYFSIIDIFLYLYFFYFSSAFIYIFYDSYSKIKKLFFEK